MLQRITTTECSSGRRRGVGGSLACLLLWMSCSVVGGFVSNHRAGGIRRPLRVFASRIRGHSASPLQSQTRDEMINEIQNGDSEESSPSLPTLHQEIFQADPDWYKDYVVGILGDSYCAEQWPIDIAKEPIVEISHATKAETAISGNTTARSEGTAPNAVESNATTYGDGRAPSLKKELEISTNETILTASTNTTDYSRTVVYRNIVGNTLTYVPMQNLTNLGYSIPELERMQSDSLCVVVNDEIRNPRMGVPLQWCLQKNAPQQVQILDTLEEALTIIQEDEATRLEEKRQDREAKEQRQKMKSQPSAAVNDVDDDDAADSGPRQRRSRSGPPRPDGRRARQPSSSLSREQRQDGSSWHNGARATNGSTEHKLDRRRRSKDRNGSPKPIYSGQRDPYRNGMQRKTEDRGDPPTPRMKKLWVDYDTFKDLLRKEAEFRIRIVGEGFAPDIKRESDWRLQLYKNWLWALHDGVGDGIAPPSRYERARRMQRRGGVYEADRKEGGRDRKRRPRQRAEPKRKRRGSGPPRPR